MLPAAPDQDLLDPLGLFTHGEFTLYAHQDEPLLLFSHGEFPRSGTSGAIAVVDRPKTSEARGTRKRAIVPEILAPVDEEEILTILLAADEDEWI